MHIQELAKVVTENLAMARAKATMLKSFAEEEEFVALPEPIKKLIIDMCEELDVCANALFGIEE